MRKWKVESSYLILVSVPDEDALRTFASDFWRRAEVYEPDLNDELTAIALEPSEAARKLCSNLPLILKSAGAMM